MAGESVISLRVVDNATPTLRKVDRQAKKLAGTVKNSNGQLKDKTQSLKHAALGFLGMGGAARSATPAIHGAGAALKGALAPILPLIAAGAALQQMFGTLVKQDFSEAKYESLGGSADTLVKKLKLVSSELHNSVSVTELTAASYDVASAGFIKAADAAQVLKAASQGATGGFSDLNTTGNALTSVLNAYGVSASESTNIMDKFIQTQNDGKIVVAEYAANIGKVASVAATLNIPLSEVNAIIAQATAAGVKSEIAFTGLKTAMLKLITPMGQKKLEKYGVSVNATTIEAEGLAANLEKLKGLGSEALADVFGAESIQVMAPILKDMEKFKSLIESQNASSGVAARAAFTASDTLQGSIKRLGSSITNIFADGSELGELLKLTIKALAVTFETLGMAVQIAASPFRAVWKIVQGMAQAMGVDLTGGMQSATEGWFAFVKGFEIGFQKTFDACLKLGQAIGNIANVLKEPFKKAFEWIIKAVDAFWASLPGWVKWSVTQMQKLAGATTSAIGESLSKFFSESPAEKPGEKKPSEENKKSEESLKKQQELVKHLEEGYKNISETISQSMAGALKGLIKGTQTLGEALSNIANKITDMLLDLAISSMFKSFGLPGFAAGGRPPVGEPAVVGERGPEVFVPRQAGTIVPNHELGGGGSSTNISISVDASGSSVEGDAERSRQLGELIGAAVQTEIIKQQRPGGTLYA